MLKCVVSERRSAISGVGQNLTAQQCLCPCTNGGQRGIDIFIAATWGRHQRRWMSKTCKTTSYRTGAFLLRNTHPLNSDLCQPNRQSLQIVGDKDATLIRDAGWWTIDICTATVSCLWSTGDRNRCGMLMQYSVQYCSSSSRTFTIRTSFQNMWQNWIDDEHINDKWI